MATFRKQRESCNRQRMYICGQLASIAKASRPLLYLSYLNTFSVCLVVSVFSLVSYGLIVSLPLSISMSRWFLFPVFLRSILVVALSLRVLVGLTLYLKFRPIRFLSIQVSAYLLFILSLHTTSIFLVWLCPHVYLSVWLNSSAWLGVLVPIGMQ